MNRKGWAATAAIAAGLTITATGCTTTTPETSAAAAPVAQVTNETSSTPSPVQIRVAQFMAVATQRQGSLAERQEDMRSYVTPAALSKGIAKVRIKVQDVYSITPEQLFPGQKTGGSDVFVVVTDNNGASQTVGLSWDAGRYKISSLSVVRPGGLDYLPHA